MSKVCMRLVLALCLLLPAQAAFAEGFALYEYSARGIALGGAVMARSKADPSAIAYNPALITKLPGTHIMAGASTISPAGKMRTKDEHGNTKSSSLKNSTWFVPHAYFTQQLSDDFFFGVGEFTRFGLGFEYPHNWPGRFNIYQVSLTSFSINPNIAWKATEKLSLAAGVEVVYVNLDIKKRALFKDTSAAGPYSFESDVSIKDADDYGYGFNVAGHYQFNDQWGVGLQYRSQVKVKAYGDTEFTMMNYQGPGGPYGPAVRKRVEDGFNENFKDGEAHSTVILPESIAGGIAWTPISELSFEVGAVWTRWSTFRALDIHMPKDMDVAENRKDWRNTWRLNVGVEWDVLDWLTLRGGYVWDQSPMTDKYADYLIPTKDRDIYSLGVGFKWDDWTADLAYAYIDPHDRSYKQSDDTHVLRSKTQDGRTQIFSLSLGYSF